MSDTRLVKLLEQYDGKKIDIRPSAVDTSCNCPRQWALVFLGGQTTIPGARAAIGTAIHAAVEGAWKASMLSKTKDFNITAMQDCAVESIQAQHADGLRYDAGENQSTAEREACEGTIVFAEDIAPFVDIPEAVEQRFSIEIEHPIVQRLSGTVDYLSSDTLADLKTSKRKPVPQSYCTQQSIYKLLAEANGKTVKHNTIQGVVLKQDPVGHVLPLEPNVQQARFLVNSLLDTLDTFNEQKVSPAVLFRGNPKYYLCDEKYCAEYATCPYVNGTAC